MGSKKSSKGKSGSKGKKCGDNGYITFLSELRPELKEEHPDWKVTEISKEGGKRWKALSDKEKQKYKDLASKPKNKEK
jgi:hypothetical protein